MPTTSTCSRCGAPLKADVPGGLCLTCLLSFGLKDNGGVAADAGGESGETSPPPADFDPGEFTGYRVLGKLGEGGCGVVYRAEQLQPVQRAVALKVIKLGMDTQTVMARFDLERQALAMMDHPGIARVFAAGATSAGRPFFAMELVSGPRITDYCDERQLSIAQRLELFARVCEAIQHAHQKGVIHRDLKPSNILVTDTDGLPQPKIIDFGIAKATTRQRLADHTVYTAFDQFVGTPAYMSPEQAGAIGEDVDTRSDIYSLGVLLYELLTGRPPFEPERLRQAAVDEIFRIIRDEEPTRPSSRLTTLSAPELSEVSRRRFAAPPRLLRELRGDLDWVVMKALEKLPARRYETANALAAEVRRHLNSEPVLARPPSAAYRFQKMVRRNQLAFAAATTVLATLLAGSVFSSWRFFKEREARQLAVAAEQRSQAEAVRSEQAAQFLKDMLAGVGPSVALGRDTTMLREILNRAAERVEQELQDQPELEAELRAIIGRAYHEIAEFNKAEAMFREALRLRESCFASVSGPVAESISDLVALLCHRSRSKDLLEAEPLARRALSIQKTRWGDEHIEVAKALQNLAWCLDAQRRWSESEPLRRELLALHRTLPGIAPHQLAGSLTSMAALLHQSPDGLDEAEAMAREAHDLQLASLGADHPWLADTHHGLGQVLEKQGRMADAEKEVREVIRLRRLHWGDKHVSLASTLSHLARVLIPQARLDEAEIAIREAIELHTEHHGPDHSHIPIYLMETLVLVLADLQRWTEAEAVASERIAILRRDPALEDVLLHALHWQAIVFIRQRKWVEAEPVLRETLTLCERLASAWTGSQGLEMAFHIRRSLGETLLRQRQFTEAEELLLGAHEGLKPLKGHWDIANLEKGMSNLAELYEATGRPAQAAEWKQRLAEFEKRQAGRD